eukprot:1624232-Prymnesium_polylepis.1
MGNARPRYVRCCFPEKLEVLAAVDARLDVLAHELGGLMQVVLNLPKLVHPFNSDSVGVVCALD